MHIYDIDLDHKVCGKYKVISFEKMQFQWVQDVPLKECNGFYALDPADTQKVKACAETSIKACRAK